MDFARQRSKLGGKVARAGHTFGDLASITVVLCGPSEEDDDDDEEAEIKDARSILSRSLSDGLIVKRLYTQATLENNLLFHIEDARSAYLVARVQLGSTDRNRR